MKLSDLRCFMAPWWNLENVLRRWMWRQQWILGAWLLFLDSFTAMFSPPMGKLVCEESSSLWLFVSLCIPFLLPGETAALQMMFHKFILFTMYTWNWTAMFTVVEKINVSPQVPFISFLWWQEHLNLLFQQISRTQDNTFSRSGWMRNCYWA